MTRDDVLQLFDYDAEHGRLLSKKTRKPVGFLDRHGYLLVRIGQSNALVHRLIFLIEHGFLPAVVDHISRDVLDNRASNLRAADKSTNGMNQRIRQNNSSGAKGVSWDKRRKKWHAYVQAGGRRVYSDFFDDKQVAANASAMARARFHGEFCRHA